MSEPTPLSAEAESFVRKYKADGNAAMLQATSLIDAQATEIAILKDGRCVSCMEPVNPLHPKCACIRAEIAEMEAEIAALKGALEGIVSAIDAHHPKYRHGPFTLTRTEVEAARRVLAGKGAQGA